MIVGGQFGLLENTQMLERVFRDAILSHGLCDRLYTDNGPAFSSQYLSKVCAYLNIGLPDLLTVQIIGEMPVTNGQDVQLSLTPSALHVFDQAGTALR